MPRLLPVPGGTEIKNWDEEDKYQVFGDLPVYEMTELAKFAGKVWLWGPLSALQDPSEDE